MNFVIEEEKPVKKNHSLWVEKYRPSSMEKYIGNESVKEKFAQIIAKGDVPNILLFGPAGTGKTSLAKLLTKNVKCDVMYMNASDQNRIDDVRLKIKEYASSAGFNPIKIIVLDEADRLTPDAQQALRNIIETYSSHTRFIMTCNYVEKMIPPIVSRLQTFEIKPVSKKDVAVRLVEILRNENVQFTQEDVVFIVNNYYPDIRKVINFAQQSTIESDSEKQLKIAKENVLETDLLARLVELLKTPGKAGVFNEIRELTTEFDCNSIEIVVKYLFEKIDDYAKGKEALVILELGELNWRLALVIAKARDITFLASMYNILKILKE
jgi:DNA polymerase III delta prime subunit